MPHKHLGFQLFHSLKRNAYNDQDGGAAQREAAHTCQRSVNDRQQSDQRQEQRSDQRNLGKNLGNKLDRKSVV